MQFPTQVAIDSVPLFAQGKVREMYDLGDHFLMVASDRLSAFDVVMPTPIEGKGKILNQLSVFWFELLHEMGYPTHFVTADPDQYPAELQKWNAELRGRSMLCRKAQRIDVECVARGYVVGSGWKDYQATGAICGIALPQGLQLCEKLETPIFTPAAKNDIGHDENVDFETMRQIAGDASEDLRRLTMEIYGKARDFAAQKGILLADTKFEFGFIDGQLCLIDEVLTPDSSRYWPAKQYQVGVNQESFDKQYVRDWLETLDWDKTYPGPQIPAEVQANALAKYIEIFELLTNKKPVL